MEETIDTEHIQALESFLLDNPELDRLEALLGQFNVFETLNIVQVEVRHSYILAWLLNPSENHGLGNYFLRQFLKYHYIENKSSLQEHITLFDLERLNLTDVEIRREWRHIDILIVITEQKDKGKIVIAIENKVRSLEHDNQLQRYRETIAHEFPEYLKFHIYLTPDNNLPTSDESWNPSGYITIANLIDNLLEYKKDVLNENILEFIKQYRDILRRYIVGSSEIEKICAEIYGKHAKALELIFKYRPDMALQVSEFIQARIKSNPKLRLDSAGKTVIRFTTETLDSLIERVGEGWSSSKRIFLFEFSNYYDQLILRLYIGPGPEAYREHLFNICHQAPNIFKLVERKHGTKWHAVYQKKFLDKKDFSEGSLEDAADKVDITDKISRKWHEFIDNDLIKIEEHFAQNWNTKPS